jgi:hypothetical protein
MYFAFNFSIQIVASTSNLDAESLQLLVEVSTIASLKSDPNTVLFHI